MHLVPNIPNAPDPDERSPMDSTNPIPGAMHPMCDCPEFHHKSCFFYDEWIDASDDEIDEMLDTGRSYGTVELTANKPIGRNTGMVMPSTASSTKDADDWFWAKQSCKHNMSPLRLPSGATVYASAWRDIPYGRTAPDVGVYLDPSWFPADGFAYAIGWQDFGLPTIADADVVRTARAVLDHLEYGETVEVGCIGAHGRTGTFLALLVIMDSFRTSQTFGYKRAISYVRTNHCFSAIETRSQEQWIRRMSGLLVKGLI